MKNERKADGATEWTLTVIPGFDSLISYIYSDVYVVMRRHGSISNLRRLCHELCTNGREGREG
jgi:hypothetical protein